VLLGDFYWRLTLTIFLGELVVDFGYWFVLRDSARERERESLMLFGTKGGAGI